MFHMSMELYEKINELGRLIKASPEYQAMKTAEAAFEADPAAKQQEAEYALLQKRIEEAQNKGDMQLINALVLDQETAAQAIASLPSSQQLRFARSQMNDLLRGTVEALQGIVYPDVECSCGGNCEGCSGCG